MSEVEYKYDGLRTWHENPDNTWSPVMATRRYNGEMEYELGAKLSGPEYFKLRLQGKIRVTKAIQRNNNE